MNGPASSAGNASGIAANAITGAIMYSAYPPSKSMPVTLRLTHIAKSPRWHCAHTKQCPPCQPTPTRCPGRHALTLSPTASMCPATSCPGTRGYCSPGQRPSLTSTSLWHMPHASTFTRTCPASGSGISRSTNSQSPLGLLTCAACILVLIMAPIRDECARGTCVGGRVARTRSITINLEDSFGKGLRRFLRQIVPDAARDHPVRIWARKLLGIFYISHTRSQTSSHCSASASLPRQPPPHPLLDCWSKPGPIVGIATLTEGFRLRRVRMKDGSEFPQTDASRHRHTDFTDHLPSMARHDGRPADCIRPL